jgi:endogenous inhibitor of DNA gyrase (YacG/DUF329 family)
MAQQKPLVVKCPSCGAEVPWQESSTFRPFCSARCRDQDFIAWANGDRAIAGSDEYDDLLSGDLPPRE